MRSKKSFSATKPTFVIFITSLLVVPVAAVQQARAQTFKVLHTFHGSDGIGPQAQLVRDSDGNIYGTAGVGGSSKCQDGCGTAFKLNKYGSVKWVHSFDGADGQMPFPGLLRDATGNLYGTTIEGGKVNRYCSTGCGVVFKLDNTGKETVLHGFTANPDGYYPVGPLVRDKAGNFYGTTQLGGEHGLGTVFKLSPTGKETILYSFGGGAGGCAPGASVILDSAGDIYGTTFMGGSGYCNSGNGVIFKVDITGKETVLYTLEGSDGSNPWSPLTLDSAGNLYGSTKTGGNLGCDGGLGCGVAFELSPTSNGDWVETVLYRFCSALNCADGQFPSAGALVRDATGSLYGTTIEGGTDTSCSGGNGCGVVFKLDVSGGETIVHNFSGGTEGYYPLVGVTRDASGNLYGTALFGGAHGDGILFKIIP